MEGLTIGHTMPSPISDQPSAMTARARLRRGASLWLPAGRPRRRYPTFEGRRDADVAIIGGGMTGAVAALEFAAAGASVVLLEAELVGRGSTSASSALLLQEPDMSIAQLATRYGRAAAVRIAGADDRVRIRTARGRLEARRVVIATGYATERFRPLAGSFRTYDTYVLATPPLGRADRRELGLGDVMIWDTERPYH